MTAGDAPATCERKAVLPPPFWATDGSPHRLESIGPIRKGYDATWKGGLWWIVQEDGNMPEHGITPEQAVALGFRYCWPLGNALKTPAPPGFRDCLVVGGPRSGQKVRILNDATQIELPDLQVPVGSLPFSANALPRPTLMRWTTYTRHVFSTAGADPVHILAPLGLSVSGVMAELMTAYSALHGMKRTTDTVRCALQKANVSNV